MTVVDVGDPDAPVVVGRIRVGDDPTRDEVRRGRIAFNDAAASSSRTFSCASCHPDGHVDQLVWRIGGACSPDLDPGCGGDEPRLTMPIRGLRDTLPLHWDGTLGDPFGGGNGAVGPEGDGGTDCALGDADGDHDCFLDLVRASLAGVMCDQTGPCPPGGRELPLAAQSDMAHFLGAVSHSPARSRRLDDSVSTSALDGFADFFVNQGGISRGTCADSDGGCHALPLLTFTNGSGLGAFDAPSLRGLTDRFVQFSLGHTASVESLDFAAHVPDDFRPRLPDSEIPWDPQRGLDERTTFAAAFLGFRINFGVGPIDILQMLEELSTGSSGAAGRQVTLGARTLAPGRAAGTLALLDALEVADARGVVVLRGRGTRAGVPVLVSYGAPQDAYPVGPDVLSRAELEREAETGALLVTLTAHLPRLFGRSPQPLLSTAETGEGPTGDPPLPVLSGDGPIAVHGARVRRDAALFVDGERVEGVLSCTGADFEPFCASEQLRIALAALPAPDGLHLLQIQNPGGPLSNELPICVGLPRGCR